MKLKKIMAVLSACLMMGTVTMEPFSLTANAEGTLGDVNNDFIINSMDASHILHECCAVAVEGSILTDEQKNLADVDGNGVVNAEDSMYILRTATLTALGAWDYFSDSIFTPVNYTKDTDKNVTIQADSVNLTLKELQENDFVVPVVIRGEVSAIPYDADSKESNGSCFEFGISVDGRCEHKVPSWYDNKNWYEKIEIIPDYECTTRKNGNLTWFAYADSNNKLKKKSPVFAVLSVQIPSDAKEGDTFPIEFTVPESQKDLFTVVDYKNNIIYRPNIEYLNGEIKIVSENDSTPLEINVSSLIDLNKTLKAGKAPSLKYDLNGDNIVNVIDLALLKQKLLNQ